MMKTLKATFEAPITFTYELNLSEDDLLRPIEEFIRRMKTDIGMREIAEEMYHCYKEELLTMLEKNIILKSCEITEA